MFTELTCCYCSECRSRCRGNPLHRNLRSVLFSRDAESISDAECREEGGLLDNLQPSHGYWLQHHRSIRKHRSA